MRGKGNGFMEKPVGEEDLNGLEAEIDSAVDRLFVEERQDPAENTSMEFSASEPASGTGKTYQGISEKEKHIIIETPILEKAFMDRPVPPPSPAVERDSFTENVSRQSVSVPADENLPPLIRSRDDRKELPRQEVPDCIERLESQLLCLEREITEETIEKARVTVADLRNRWGDRTEIVSVSKRMETILDSMSKNERDIYPPSIKFLMDAKETIRIVTQNEPDQDQTRYKQLALDGIEARFISLRDGRGTSAVSTNPLPEAACNDINEIAEKLNCLSGEMKQSLDEIAKGLQRLETQMTHKPLETIMVFRLGGRFFGVRNDQVFKLFRVPAPFHEKYRDQQHIRVRDIAFKLVDLEKRVPMAGRSSGEELKILIVKYDTEYKGLMIEQVVQKLSIRVPLAEGSNDLFTGSLPWTYQAHPVEISVLNLSRL